MPLEHVSLTTIGDGKAEEIFDREMRAVLDNVGDDNTKPNEARRITLEITITPDEDREMAFVQVRGFSKLAKSKPAVAPIYFGKQSGKYAAYRHDPRQVEMPFTRPQASRHLETVE